MKQITVDISDYAATADPGAVLITYALGSCIAVMIHDAKRRAGGMIHFMLPHSKTAPEKAADKPAMFADTGVPALFQAMYALGCNKKDLVVKVAGAGSLYDDRGMFRIGERNYTMLRRLLWQNDVLIAAEDVGGARSRTARLEVATGRVVIKSQGEEKEL